MLNLKSYWDSALSFEEYWKNAEFRTASQDPDDPYTPYYELGMQRMERTLKTFKKESFESYYERIKGFEGRILIISEPWCGDASTTVPVLAKFIAEAGIPVKIFLRDQDKSLINEFLTDGSESIPKVLILDKDFMVKDTWGPRPEFGTQLLQKFKSDPKNYPREEFYNDLQVYYAKNRGKDAVEEIVNLLNT